MSYEGTPWRPNGCFRAILKSASVCAMESERVARFIVDKGYTER